MKFGRLTAVTYLGYSAWECVCECGRRTKTKSGNLVSGGAQSCGCARLERLREKATHGMHSTPEYHAYMNARRRCDPNNTTDFDNYAGRGITFGFKSFEQWYAELGPRPTHLHTVDRVNNDGNYEPGNVRWATRSENLSNRRQGWRKSVVSEKLIDLVGVRFGRLTVTGYCGSRNPSKASMWGCVCDCGTGVVANGKLLKRGKKKSCGCLRPSRVPMN